MGCYAIHTLLVYRKAGVKYWASMIQGSHISLRTGSYWSNKDQHKICLPLSWDCWLYLYHIYLSICALLNFVAILITTCMEPWNTFTTLARQLDSLLQYFDVGFYSWPFLGIADICKLNQFKSGLSNWVMKWTFYQLQLKFGHVSQFTMSQQVICVRISFRLFIYLHVSRSAQFLVANTSHFYRKDILTSKSSTCGLNITSHPDI